MPLAPYTFAMDLLRDRATVRRMATGSAASREATYGWPELAPPASRACGKHAALKAQAMFKPFEGEC